MANEYYIGRNDMDRLQASIRNYPDNAEKVINDVLHNTGGDLIIEDIKLYMPVSGRKPWPKKALPAKTSKSLQKVGSNLAVEISATKKYKYLYFPNDGSNTRHHNGGQWFMERGAEKAEEGIITNILERLEEKVDV